MMTRVSIITLNWRGECHRVTYYVGFTYEAFYYSDSQHRRSRRGKREPRVVALFKKTLPSKQVHVVLTKRRWIPAYPCGNDGL
jgi:hypothetical protein